VQDLKYDAITLETDYREILDSLKTSDLSAVTRTFITNVNRVYALLRLPVVIPHLMGLLVNAVLPALSEVGGQISLTSGEVVEPIREMIGEIANLSNTTRLTPHAAMDLLNTKLDALGDENSDTVRNIRFLTKVMVNIAKAFTITLDKSKNPYINLNMTETDVQAWSRAFATVIAIVETPARGGFEGVLTGSIVGTWTAIEALAGDLWEAALNAEPEILSKLKGQVRREKGKNESDKQLDLNSVHRYNFVMRKVMGTILRKRFAFTLLDGIVEAYEAAFSKDGTAVLAVIKDRALFRLSCVRNVIVHRGGLVDEEFHTKMKKEARFSGLQIGETITIDGEVTNELIGPAVRCGVKLIEEVDQWLASHPGKVR